MQTPARFLAACFAITLLHAQNSPAWNASVQARGWAFCDVDGSFLFLEPVRQEFVHWDLASGLRAVRPAPTLEEHLGGDQEAGAPEDPYSAAARLLYGMAGSPAKHPGQVRRIFPNRWILDPKDHCWATVGKTLLESDDKGRILSRRTLPGQVTDMVRVRDGFFLCYRTLNPYVQKFNWKGEAIWAFKKKGDTPSDVPLHRIAANSDDTVLLAELGALSFSVLGPGATGQFYFTRAGAVAEPLGLGKQGRLSMAYCPARKAILAVFSESEGRAAGFPDGKGLALGCFLLGKGTLEWHSTGLGEGHQLVGVTTSGAVFTSPSGGISVVPIP